VNNAAVDPAQHLVAVGVDTVADHAGTAGKADLLKVTQQGVNGARPGPSGTPHGLAGTDDVTRSAFGRGQRLERRCGIHEFLLMSAR
jgi:hypothetical protein